jgi:hypothetical protein
MKRYPSRGWLASLILIGAILACNAPSTVQPISVNDQAATVIAATLQAQAQNGGDVPITATASITLIPTIQATSTGAGTASVTPTFSTPMLTVLQQTNCREGPGQDYEVVFTYLEKKKLQILGRYDPTNYWLVKSVESRTGSCWLWGEYVEVSGSYWVVPSVTPPPTATPAPPQAPSLQNWEFSCAVGQMTITIEWTDRATDETGYRILRDGESVAELPPDSTSYTETIPLLSGESAQYYIQVFSPGGTANTLVGRLTC